MVIPNTPSLLETRNPLLLQSANSLDCALAQFNKLTTSIERNGTSQVVPKETSIAEWLLGPVSEVTYQSYPSYTVSTSEPESPIFGWASSPALSTLGWNMPSEVLDLTSPEPELEHGSTATAATTSNKRRSSSPSSSSKRPRPAGEEECSDELLARRAKNTDAARRSRLKKMVRMEGLETKVSGLESTNQTLSTKVAVLETERNGHLVKEAEQMARIAQLEAKLIETQLAFALRRIQ
ncbi:hypothetical protein BGX24_001386 [Mortierella sp. AD032]|nr:hypothetical protein BGX24_001386 [Mortierella sp. AD032]